MAVDITLLNSNSLTNIQTNFDRVEAALEETLGRNGDTPNSMNADIDMNSNDVLNVGRIDVQEFYMDGNPIISIPGIGEVVAIAQEIIDVAAISDQVVLVANNIASIDLVGTNIGSVIIVASNMSSVVTVASNISAINTNNANSTNINTVATNITSINSVALNAININAVNANATNINTVATNNTNINTVVTNLAAILDAPTQATNAANSAIAAAASAASINPLALKMDTRRNNFVNGSITMSQENSNTLGTTNGYFAADQFALYFTAATAAMSIQRIPSRSLAGSANKLEFKTTTAKASLGASDVVTITQPIEGSRPDFVAAGWGSVGAKPFMVRVDQQITAGLYHVHATNSANNRHIAVPFTATGSEAVIEVAIPGDTGGTWLTADGTIGVVIDIVLAAGATLTGGTASTWGAATYFAASTQFNILSSTSNSARLTDFGLRLDPDATGVYGAYEVGYTDAVYRSERYFNKLTSDGVASVNFGSGYLESSPQPRGAIAFSPMDKPPTIATSAAATFNAMGPGGPFALSALSFPNISRSGATFNATSAAFAAGGYGITLQFTATAFINLSARLS